MTIYVFDCDIKDFSEITFNMLVVCFNISVSGFMVELYKIIINSQ